MSTDTVYKFSCLLKRGTGSRELTRGLQTSPQTNQEPLVVRDKVERRAGELRLSKSWNVIIFPFSAFRVLEETTGTTADDLDEDGAERPRFPWAVMDRRSRPGPEQTSLEAVGNQWCYCGWPGWRRRRTTSTPTGCHGPTQSTWPRTDHSGGCWRPVALRTRSSASWRRWWVLGHCWLDDRKNIQPVKSWVLVRWWWRFDGSFRCLIAPAVTITALQ